MTLISRRERKDLTPEETEQMEQMEKEINAQWQEYLKHKDEKPSWMPGPEASEKEWLEFQAYTMPFKIQQIIDIYEQQADSLSDFAYNVYDDRPKERKAWLKKADDLRKKAEQIRQEKWIYRAVADQAKRRLRRKY